MAQGTTKGVPILVSTTLTGAADTNVPSSLSVKTYIDTSIAASGTVTSVGFTGGLISVANPTTTPALTVAGTSGGIPYFSSASTWASSGALTANTFIIGGGAGATPYVSGMTYSSDASFNYITAPSGKGIFLKNSTGEQRIYADDTFTEIIANYTGGANGSSVTLQSGSIVNTAAAHYWYTSGGNDYNFANDVAGGATRFGILNFGSIATTNKTFTFPNTSGTIALTSDLSSYVPTTRSLTINGSAQTLAADRTWTITTTGTLNRISVSGGTGLTPTIDIDAAYVGQTSITTLGTITTGTWNASVLNSTYGGTGVNNAGRTLTINTNNGILDFTSAVTLTIANTASISGTNTGDNATNSQYSGLAASKQDTLISGTNIKTINGSTVLGSGDLVVSGALPELVITDLSPSLDQTITAGYCAYYSGYYEIADTKYLEIGDGSILEIG